MVKLFLKNSNLCDHNSPTLQTDRQTTCDRNTALCTKVHRAVKNDKILQINLFVTSKNVKWCKWCRLTWATLYMYRVGQIKWHHFTFLLVANACINKILWILAQINYIKQQTRWCYFISTLVRQRALQTWALSLCIIAVLLTLNFSTLTVHSLLKFDSKEKFIWFCSIHHWALYLFYKWLPVLPVFCCKNNAVQYHSLRWVKSHEKIELWWRHYELRLTSGKNLSSRRYIKEFVSQKWSKSHLDQLIRKVDAGWLTDSFIDQGRMCDFLWESAARMRRTRDDTRGAPSVLPIH